MGEEEAIADPLEEAEGVALPPVAQHHAQEALEMNREDVREALS